MTDDKTSPKRRTAAFGGESTIDSGGEPQRSRTLLIALANASASIECLLIGAILVYLLSHAYIGFHSRYMADDFAFHNEVTTHGIFAAQKLNYLKWQGTFGQTFLAVLVSSFGPRTVPFTPGLILMLFVVAGTWSAYQFTRLLAIPSPLRSAAFFALLALFATIRLAPNIVDSLYHQETMITYVPPLVGASILTGLITRSITVRDRNRFVLLLACFAVSFVTGGFNNSFVAMQPIGLAFALLVSKWIAPQNVDSRVRPALLSSLAGSALSLVIVTAAPGNKFREALLPKHPPPVKLAERSLLYAIGFPAKWAAASAVIVISLALAVGLRVAARRLRPDVAETKAAVQRQRRIRLLIAVPTGVFAVVVAGTLPAVWALSEFLPARAQILLLFVLVSGGLLWCGLLARTVSPPLKTLAYSALYSVAAIATLLIVTTSAVSVLRWSGPARAFAADWDRQDKAIRKASADGMMDVVVPQIGDMQSRLRVAHGEYYLRKDRSFWINGVEARYYGVKSISASTEQVP